MYLDDKGNPKKEEQLQPSSNAVFSSDGSTLPFDVANKTLLELKQMGFEDVMSVTMQSNPLNGELKPNLPADERYRLQNVLKDMEKDMNDPTHHLEGDTAPLSQQDESLDQPKN